MVELNKNQKIILSTIGLGLLETLYYKVYKKIPLELENYLYLIQVILNIER